MNGPDQWTCPEVTSEVGKTTGYNNQFASLASSFPTSNGTSWTCPPNRPDHLDMPLLFS